MLSSKSIQNAVAQIDVGNAERYAFERWSIPNAGNCVDPNQLTFDAYHRQAHPDSLTRTQGGSCSALDSAHNLQAWLNREAAVDRPWIPANLAGGYRYDTMGNGRNVQTSYTGGTQDNRGGWYRMAAPAPMQDPPCNRPPVHYTTDPARPKDLSVISTKVWNG